MLLILYDLYCAFLYDHFWAVLALDPRMQHTQWVNYIPNHSYFYSLRSVWLAVCLFVETGSHSVTLTCLELET